MICVAANSQDSLDNIEKWRTEIFENNSSVPITLCLTKKDLVEYIDNPVTLDMLK